MTRTTTQQRTKLDFNADSVEIFRSSSSSNEAAIGDYPTIVACGTYELDEVEGRRNGRLYAYKMHDPNSDGQISLDLIESFNVCGILDMKWSMCNGYPTLAMAKADGSVELMSLIDHNSWSFTSTLSKTLTDNEERSDVLCLSLDWSKSRMSCENGSDGTRMCDGEMLAVSMSDGSLAVCQVGPAEISELWRNDHAHAFEAWITAFDTFDRNVLYSGGDDCALSVWDIRASDHVLSRKRSMGVTSIQHSPCDENLLLTGGYDEIVCQWDTRNWKRPVDELSIGGGVWRIKFHPQDPSLVATASMHNGFHILNIETKEILSNYTEHESLAYGIDWLSCRNEGNNPEASLVSSSFYDKALHVWSCAL
jgi:diphthine methyl ester acylhydrolase